MFTNVTFLTFLLLIVLGSAVFRTCVPNSQFILNGHLCYCNNAGQWSESSCQLISRRQTCQPGQIVWEDCSQCICQDDGKLLCTNSECAEENFKKNNTVSNGAELWCTPFNSYYINCSLCVCPASGKMSQARCATDSSCSLKGQDISIDVIGKTICIPKVMYLFKCLHCLCSDEGVFDRSKCVETCQKPLGTSRRCIPKTFYRVDCNVYRCPENGLPENSICSKSKCEHHQNINTLSYYRHKALACVPHSFTAPKCIYCECNSNRILNENSCFEQDCLKISDFSYDSVKSVCSPGELVPICMECFCPRTGLTDEKYCTRVCSLQNKMIMLEGLLKDKEALIDRILLKEISSTDMCDPNSVFLYQGRYCLCPENGNSDNKLCTSVIEDTVPRKLQKVVVEKAKLRNFNISCEPNTFIEIGCNTCFCTKSGKIDPKWCTFDDCEAKKIIQENQKIHNHEPSSNSPCVPGSISKLDCNTCICSSTGFLKDRVCTHNNCSTIFSQSVSNLIVCEPSSYYTVDCNICFCPNDGYKNVEKCTKTQCEYNYMRSDYCTPGDLFSEDCNICVCPPDGLKIGKACTNNTCSENDTTWKKIFKLSQSLLDNQLVEEERNLDLCFPGEEFEVDCKTCVCPEMGLRLYASCIPARCDENGKILSAPSQYVNQMASSDELYMLGNDDSNEDLFDEKDSMSIPGIEDRDKDLRRNCRDFTYDINIPERPCTPGSEYIVGCQVCVCPYSGSLNNFCRSLGKDQNCEEIYFGVPITKIGRRRDTLTNVTRQGPIKITDNHNHTKYKCSNLGPMMDDCYLCRCEDGFVMYEEHCFKNQDQICHNVTNKFIVPEYKIYNYKVVLLVT